MSRWFTWSCDDSRKSCQKIIVVLLSFKFGYGIELPFRDAAVLGRVASSWCLDVLEISV